MDELQTLRSEIDHIDSALLSLLEARLYWVEKVGDHKRQFGLPIEDPIREDAVRLHVTSLAQQYGMDVEIVRQIYAAIIKLAKVHQGNSQ